jgi:hypothetical protein
MPLTIVLTVTKTPSSKDSIKPSCTVISSLFSLKKKNNAETLIAKAVILIEREARLLSVILKSYIQTN